MASYVYGLVAADIKVPGHDLSQIGVASESLDQGDLTQAIEDAAGLINALLDRSGITPGTSLDDDTHAACVAAIKAYAQAEALKILGDTGERYEAAWSQWQMHYSNFAAHPENLGSDYVDGLSCHIDDLTGGTEPDIISDGEFDFMNGRTF